MSRQAHLTASILCVASTLVIAVALCPEPADAMTVAELGSGTRSVAATSRSLAGKRWNNRAETQLVDRIDRLADAFHDLAADGAVMPDTAAALVDLLASVRKRYTDVLEKMQAEVIRIDGDLEAVQDSAAWRQRELLAMRVLYRLNWIRYERAMRYERSTAVRKRLLEQAAAGFAEFLGSGDPALTAEALLGRGLTSKALKRYPRAIEDFLAALEQRPDAEMAARIRIAMVEAELGAGRTSAALDTSRRLVAATARGGAATLLRPQALFLRAKTLLLAVPGARAGEVAAMRKEAAGALEELYGLGGYWRSKVIQLVDAGIDDPDAWADLSSSPFVTWLVADSLRRRDRCDRAVAHYDRLLEADQFKEESLFGRGFCRFQDGRYDEALVDLGAYLDVAAADGDARDRAAYLRFKAAESLYLRAPGAEQETAGRRYFEMMSTFVAIAPEHQQAFEAWFRLGEWHRERAEFQACAEAFANVSGNRAFEIKAGFLSAQCRVEHVLAAPDDQPAPPDLVRSAVAALDGFLAEAAELRAGDGLEQERALAPLEAKATLMGAAIVTRSGVGTMEDRLERLDGFEKRFPGATDLVPEVRSLRIVAYRTVGDMDGAGTELEALLAQDSSGSYRGDPLRKLGIVFLEEAARRHEAGDLEGAERSRRVALRIYETLLADARAGGPAPPEGMAGLERLVSDLQTQIGS
ncbi:MAG: tetratricopeptide repeat protein [Candidatus Binatia bacterium]